MLNQLDSENADRDLTSYVCCLTATPDASSPMQCQALVYLGDGTKNLDGTGGTFKMKIDVGSQESHEISFTVTAGDVRSYLWSPIFPVVENTEVKVYVLSPNAADSDVDVIAKLYDCFPVNVSSGEVESNVVTMANDVIDNDVVKDDTLTPAKFNGNVPADVNEWLGVAVTADANDVPNVNINALTDDVLEESKFKDACLTKDKCTILDTAADQAELSALPDVDASPRDQMQWLFQSDRNEQEWVDNGDGTGEERRFNDAGAKKFIRGVTYDEDGFDKDEWEAAP